MSQGWNQPPGHPRTGSSGDGNGIAGQQTSGVAGSGSVLDSKVAGSNGQLEQQAPFVLPSISGLNGGGYGEYGVGGQRLPSMQSPLGQTGQSSTKGFSVASLNNPLLTQPQQQQQPQHQQQQQQHQQHQQQHTPQMVPAEQSHDPSYRPLNVKDALSYLEQVKFQFNNRPDVYNHFLDIMKDFKSQAIDTPGVIERVSNLFQGYPNLIQGFNTFLPQGYKIECSKNPNDPHPIKVTTPFGSSKEMGMGHLGIIDNTSPESPHRNHVLPQQAEVTTNEEKLQESKRDFNQVEQQAQAALHHVPEQNERPAQNNQHVPLQSQQQLQPLAAPQQPQFAIDRKNGDVEFSHAISYVNKIKTRFADQPDIYKHFLEILQTYQREQKPIHEVYTQVTLLFQHAPDLLNDFKKFLPDATAAQEHQQQQQQQLQVQQQHPHATSINGGGPFYPQQGVAHQNLPPLGSFSPPINGREGEQHQVSLPAVQHPSVDITSNQAGPTPQHIVTQGISNNGVPVSELRSTMDGVYPPHAVHSQEIQYNEPISRPEIDLDPSLVPVIPEPIKPIESDMNLLEETSFFDKAKKFIGNKQVYTEFLKILNLYSQDLLDTDDLVSKVEYYLGGNKELFDWFKSFVGFVERPKHIENIVHEKHRLDLDLCEACGPSYKKLPKTDSFMPCSGRDEMCWEVLNDEWVGHPVWASEDSGFIAHRKNQYEETLFKIEEERHEYDFYIEANLRTIQTLETIANKIANMTPEEKASFKLPPGLGHTSVTIYKKVIRKVYDKDRGFEIIDALHENPAVSVPIVLKRLKQKDEEWRRAQREWNKVWRELEQKVFFKSLDHLGLTFKQADKKLLTAKQLISEISSIKVDQSNKRVYPLTPKPKSQLDYIFSDRDVLYDVLGLVNIFIEHNATYSNSDKDKLLEFFKAFLSLFFSYSPQDVESALVKRVSKTHSNDNDKALNQDENDSVKRPREVEISLKDILTNRNKHHKSRQSAVDDETGSADQDSDRINEQNEEEEIIRQEAKKPWLLGNILNESDDHGVITNRKSFNLFANTNIYVFFRHLTTLYERLLEVKKMNNAVTEEIKSRRTVQFAKDLNLISTQLTEMGLDFSGTNAYDQLLGLCKRLIENDIEHQWFEESLRQAYKNKAFKIYTVDKVVQALVKHAHTIMTDSKTAEIMMLFEKDRKLTTTSAKEQILYRLQVRSYMSITENMFRIEFNKGTNHVCIQFVAVDDLTLKEPESLQDRWKYYITSYALSHPTEGIHHEDIQVPFLEKIIKEDQEIDDDTERYSPKGVAISKLKINVNPETYALQIEPNSQDLFSRSSINKFPIRTGDQALEAKKEEKKKLATSFLEGKNGWRKGLNMNGDQKGQEIFDFVKAHGSLENFTSSSDDKSAEKHVLKKADSVSEPNSSVIQRENELQGEDTTTEDVGGSD